MAALPSTEPGPEETRTLCRLEEIPDGRARGFLRGERNEDQIFAVRRGAAVHVYLNTCPHNWRPLEYRRDEFLSRDGGEIICFAHGAHFEIETGLCIYGPCLGARLIAVPSRIEDGRVIIPAILPRP